MEKITIKKHDGFTIDRTNHEFIAIDVPSLDVVSDGYHSIAELYDHRIALFIALCRWLKLSQRCPDLMLALEDAQIAVWRSKTHSDGSVMEGWFPLGIGKVKGKQITYHLPLSRWDETNFAETLDCAPLFDGHTSADVLERLKGL